MKMKFIKKLECQNDSVNMTNNVLIVNTQRLN